MPELGEPETPAALDQRHQEAPEAGHSSQLERIGRGRAQLVRWARSYWVLVALVVAGIVYGSVVTIGHTDRLSPYDEWVYSDYLDKVPSEVVVRQGEEVGTEARGRLACDGVFPWGTAGPPCGSSYANDDAFPQHGVTSADAYTPGFFIVTWVVGAVIRHLTGVGELTSWRLSSISWLVGALVALFLLFRRYRVPPLVTLAVGAAFIVSPYSWWTYTFVSTDAPAVFLGALLLLVAQRWLDGVGRARWLPVLAVVAVLLKITSILAVCFVGLYLLLVWLWEVRRTDWSAGLRAQRPDGGGQSLRLVGVAVLTVGFGVAAQIGWLVVHRLLAVGPAPNQAIGAPLDWRELGKLVVSFLPGAINSNDTITGVPAWAVEPLAGLCVAGVLGAVLTLRVRDRRAPLVLATGVASVLFAPMLALAVLVTTGSYFPLPPRYGGPVLPAFLLLLAMRLRWRWAVVGLFVYALGLGVVMIHYAPHV